MISKNISLIAILVATTIATNSTPAVAQSAVAYKSHVQPLLEKHCGHCHGATDPEGGLSLTKLTGDFKTPKDAATWNRIRERVQLGEMPPAEEPALSAIVRTQLANWIGSELRSAGHRPDEKLLLPGYGNYVPHERLFDPHSKALPASPPRLWRVTPFMHEQLAERLAKRTSIGQPFNLQTGEGFRDYSVLYDLDATTTEMLMRTATRAATYQTLFTFADGKVKRGAQTPDEVLKILDPANKQPTDEQFDLVIRRQFQRVLLRDPTDAEYERYRKFARKTIGETDRVRGMKMLLAAIVLTPEAVFRFEVGNGTPDKHGRVPLTPRETSFAIAYAIGDRPPDETLRKAAERGELQTREQIASQVLRLLDDPKTQQTRVLRFFQEYFGYTAAPDVFKEKDAFPTHDARFLVNDTDELILYILQQDKQVLKELLTTNKVFVDYKYDSNKKRGIKAGKRGHLAYNLPPDWKWIPEQPVEMPREERAGILTQPSWLVAHSDNFDNHAIRRGKWIREHLLGGTVPDLPITVDAQLPEDEKLTLRERMKVTKAEYCWQCHQRMNPLGLPFERFDHFGRYRTQEKERPADTTGVVAGVSDKSITGPVSDPFELLRRLADSDHVRQVFVRHAFRYWLGRNETLDDAPTLQAADRAYVESDGSMKALIVSLVTSDSFLLRRKSARIAEK